MTQKDLFIKNYSINTTVSELLSYIRINGINTDLETTNRIADILGNKTTAEIAQAAKTDINTFFFMIRFIWPLRDCIEFYNNYINQDIEQMREDLETISRENNQLKENITVAENNLKYMTEKFRETENKYYKAVNQAGEINEQFTQAVFELTATQERAKKYYNEINELKARLFDRAQEGEPKQ